MRNIEYELEWWSLRGWPGSQFDAAKQTKVINLMIT